MRAGYNILHVNEYSSGNPLFIFVDNYESINEVVNFIVKDMSFLSKDYAIGVWKIKYK